MKIAILTLPFNVNIGGLLQGFALYKVLTDMGHDVYHIQPQIAYPSNVTLTKRLIKRLIKQMIGKNESDCFVPEILPVFSNYHLNKFRQKYIKEVAPDWKRLGKGGYDAFIVGSDQIWREGYGRDLFPNKFLSFVNDDTCLKIAYAASFGTEQWEYSLKQTDLIRQQLQQFNAISVREDSAIELCNKYCGVEAKLVLDPTMLLLKDDYIRIVTDNAIPESEGTMLSYILDSTPEIKKFVNQIAIDNRLIPFSVNNPLADHWNIPCMERQQYSVYKWLRGFMDAKLIVTDSFHACVFSIIFNKPFIVIGNENRGLARFNTLLSMFNLSDRIITKVGYNTDISTTVDYSKVNKILEEKRKESLSFIRAALHHQK